MISNWWSFTTVQFTYQTFGQVYPSQNSILSTLTTLAEAIVATYQSRFLYRHLRCLWICLYHYVESNRSWIQKQGDFFVESPIILLASSKFKIMESIVTFPHAIELLNKKYVDVFTIPSYLILCLRLWMSSKVAHKINCKDKSLPQNSFVSNDFPQLYWVMTRRFFVGHQ
jgi:hypothetical protein